MSKQEWLRHADEIGFRAMDRPGRIAHVEGCRTCRSRRRQLRQNRLRRENYSVMKTLGLSHTPYGWE